MILNVVLLKNDFGRVLAEVDYYDGYKECVDSPALDPQIEIRKISVESEDVGDLICISETLSNKTESELYSMALDAAYEVLPARKIHHKE